MTRVSTAKVPYGGPLHRIVNKPVKGTGAKVRLAADHPAMIESRSLFQKSVVHPDHSPRLLVSGHNSRKIGKTVTKGAWKDLPIYTLTLEERVTCPRTCKEWATCYGNHMPWARRHMAGLDLELKLIEELCALEEKHPAGFVVRLHVLGDFYSLAYVSLWTEAMREIRGLRVFGFTAHAMTSSLGTQIIAMNDRFPTRCRIRFSGTEARRVGSRVIERLEDSRHVVCPVQTGKTDCCGTCTLCWSMDRPVEFVRH
jgi:hypothetical protein